MSTIVISKQNLEDNYNMLVSSIILSQESDFTYNDILSRVSSQIGVSATSCKLVSALNSALLRLREDGFLSLFINTYTLNKNVFN